ncbi:hypothetical protein BHE74_00059864 [Ensete ventricosum]|nr:hypothetical protein BHE74_00059864 [Ensete ventricosum]
MAHHATAPLAMPAVLVVRRAPAGRGCRPYLCQVGCTAPGVLRTSGRPRDIVQFACIGSFELDYEARSRRQTLVYRSSSGRELGKDDSESRLRPTGRPSLGWCVPDMTPPVA